MAVKKLNFIDYYICDVEADKTGNEATWGDGAIVWVLATNQYYDITAGSFVAKTTVQAITGGNLSQFAATTSAQLAGVISDETGSGALTFANTPTLVTPILGTPTSGTLTSCTGLPISTGVSGLGTGVATFLATPSSANLISAVTDETGSGALVFANTPTLVTPILGTPTSGNLSNCTALPAASITGTLGADHGGTGVANNAASTSTISGNFATTLTVTNTTGVTLPTTGTLSTLAGSETLTNKTLTSAKITTGLEPTTNDGAALGTTSKQFSDLFLAEGGVINFDNGDATITQVGDVVTLDGADLKIVTAGTTSTSVATLGATQTFTNKTIAVTQINGSAQTVGVNNTGGSANYTEVNFTEADLATYSETIAWTGTPPSSLASAQFNWSRFRNQVRVSIFARYTVAGTTNTQVNFPLPTGLPNPVSPVGLGATNDKLWPAVGYVDSALTGAPPASRAWLAKSGSGYELRVIVASQSALLAGVTCTYTTA